MAVYLIAFKLTTEGWNYSDFHGVSESLQPVKLNKYTYLIKSDLSPKAIYDTLRPHISASDTLFVIKQETPWHGHGENDLVDWVLKSLNKPGNRFAIRPSNQSWTFGI